MFNTMDMAAIFISNLLIENKCVGSKAHIYFTTSTIGNAWVLTQVMVQAISLINGDKFHWHEYALPGFGALKLQPAIQ